MINIKNIIKEEIKKVTNPLNTIIAKPEFQQWFKNSEMHKGDGSPVLFFHGSNNNFEKFDKSKIGSSTDPGWLGTGFYFYTDYNEAARYGKVKCYFLNIQNPYFATDEENNHLADENSIEASIAFTEHVRSEDCDGVYFNGDLRGETVVYEPEQIWFTGLTLEDLKDFI